MLTLILGSLIGSSMSSDKFKPIRMIKILSRVIYAEKSFKIASTWTSTRKLLPVTVTVSVAVTGARVLLKEF